MNIALVDVAAESGGALSVLMDFLDYLLSLENDTNEYYVFVSKAIDIKNERFHVVQKPEIKKTWFCRLKWELIEAKKEFISLKIDTIISLQNTGFFFSGFRQIVYFHNVLLLENKRKYSLLKKEERKYALYTRLIAPYTIGSLKKANTIISQTNTVKKKLKKKLPKSDIVVINPNVHVEEKYINTAISPIKGFIYPTSAVPFKRIEEIVKCAKQNKKWFADNKLEILITISGNENEYANKIADMAKCVEAIKLIGYQSRESILDLYKDHALIINSELESYPLPFKEAELVGTIILAASYSYSVEILKGVNNVLLFRKHQLDEMFQAMKKTVVSTLFHSEYVPNNSWENLMNIIDNEFGMR